MAATVTIGRAYFDALLRRAEFHSSGYEFELAPDLSRNVTISKEEHDYLHRCSQSYNLLKSALFRGGLTPDTLETLLAGESSASNDDNSPYEYNSTTEPMKPVSTSATAQTLGHGELQRASYDADMSSEILDLPQRRPLNQAPGHVQPDVCTEYSSEEGKDYTEERGHGERIPVHDQRTILVTNLSDRTTHKDLLSVIRGGRLLDIYLRHDRSATVSFVEGAAEFLSYAKRNDIYLYTKRLEFRWADRQFHVPPHVSNKIASGATRNLVVRGIGGRVTEERIRDHLDHIHNLAVIDIYFKNGDAHISTNSIHNALFARTCMMSRTTYKGTKIEWASDECAVPLPQLTQRTRTPAMHIPVMAVPMTNMFALLDTGSDADSDSQPDSYLANGIRLGRNDWANTAVA